MAEDDPERRQRGGGAGGELGGLGPFRAADGQWVFLCAWTDRNFRELCDLAGFPEVGQNPEYATRLQRSQHGADLNSLFAH